MYIYIYTKCITPITGNAFLFNFLKIFCLCKQNDFMGIGYVHIYILICTQSDRCKISYKMHRRMGA